MIISKITRWQWLYIQLFLMMCIMMAVSFLPENYHSFFGDWKCQGSGNIVEGHWHYEKCNYGHSSKHEPTWHWGWRHYILILFGFAFSVINIVRLVCKWDKLPE